MPKKFISITGMSGSGKTTLFNQLQETYKNSDIKVGFMYECARNILTNDMIDLDLSKYIKTKYELLTEEDQLKYQLWQSKLCLNFRENLDKCVDADVIISDRSPIDQLVYYMLQCNDKNSQMYHNILNMLSKISSEYENIVIMLDTPLDDVQRNLRVDVGHHYTENLYHLLNEKAMFLTVLKELDFLDKVYLFNGNDTKLLNKVMQVI